MFRSLRQRVSSMFPLGITARLSISFVAVAILAATANMIARETASIVYLSAPHEHPAPPPVSHRTITTPAHSNLTSAVEAFERIGQLRVDSDSKATQVEFSNAAEALRQATVGTGPLGQQAADYLHHGLQWVRIADQRKSARITQFKLTAALNDRIETSLNQAWKIFGRVLARQSLIQMRVGLDRVRQLSEKILGGEVLGAGEIDEMAAAESAFSQSFADNKPGLLKSEGQAWVNALQADFGALVKSRENLGKLNFEYQDASHHFSQSRAKLTAAILIADLESQQVNATQPDRHAAGTSTAADAIDTLRAGAPLAETAIRSSNRVSRDVMAVVTALVMLLVIVISIATVRSVLNPMHRILDGSARLAKGQEMVQVHRGGIRELDTLADAFNSMAASLASAQEVSRHQQATLEDKVLERTHRLQQLAEQDPLTSLPNRRHLFALLNDALERAARENHRVAMYFLDIDNFKTFNDSEGHVFGDRVLMSVANRLEEIADGLGFVARLGGDEFTLVCGNLVDDESVREIGQRIVSSFQKLISVDERELSLSVSVGASIFPQHAGDAQTLLRAADSALFRAKELGRNQLAIFTPELIRSAAARFATEQGLRRALESQQFELLYQPEFNLATMEMDLVEALLRWRMPDGRLARPAEFLEVAEASGLISEINAWVLRTAIAAAARWHHGQWPEVRLAVNISPRQLMDQRFPETLRQLLHEYRLPSTAIEFELTETVLQTGPSTIAALRVLQSMGIGIALDDFGTGYSSLTSLEQLPLTRIKLDRSLIASIDSSDRAASIARAIIDLCAGLALKVTAEGIERPEQLAWLMSWPALLVQGYLLSEALPFAEVLLVKPTLAKTVEDLLLSMPPSRRRPITGARRATDRPAPLKRWQ
jgi:diguanylate cyclase (GGDEF)-like protein